jgi:putative sterol carrier protein
MLPVSIEDLIALVPTHIDSTVAESLNAVIQIIVTGEGGGNWVITIVENHCQVQAGRKELADVTISADARDALEIFQGAKNPVQAYMLGQIDFSGNSELAMKLFKVFSAYRSAGKLKLA